MFGLIETDDNNGMSKILIHTIILSDMNRQAQLTFFCKSTSDGVIDRCLHELRLVCLFTVGIRTK